MNQPDPLVAAADEGTGFCPVAETAMRQVEAQAEENAARIERYWQELKDERKAHADTIRERDALAEKVETLTEVLRDWTRGDPHETVDDPTVCAWCGREWPCPDAAARALLADTPTEGATR